MALEQGELVIANEFDRPCARLICEVIKEEGEVVLLQYLDARVDKGGKLLVEADRVSRVQDFGVRLRNKSTFGYCEVEHTKPSTVAYPNGNGIRPWQPELGEVLQLKDTMTDWSRHYCCIFFYKYFCLSTDPMGALALSNYVLPFIQELSMGEFYTLSEAMARAEKIKGWIEHDSRN